MQATSAVARVPLTQLHPAPWNPRHIKDPRFDQLCRSMEADPDFLWQRPVLATQDGTVFAGNMRLRAAQQLGWTDIPAILCDIPEQLAKERALRDNNQFGEWLSAPM
ncbi:MAG: ParB N-terminal domain-containing protein [Acetobacteraceae bacterium]|nr:ParB N-terminal domain-containing protein [Solirubrobacterales bacterium]MBV8578372.1 ParB N-terminal domain-containing protein [Acetobacteraceae bacterium]